MSLLVTVILIAAFLLLWPGGLGLLPILAVYLFVIPVIIVVYLGVLGMLGQGPWRTHGIDPAEETLRNRYIRGEVTKEQFQEMMKDLRNSRQ